MIRLYLDTNILTALKSNYTELKEYLLKNKENILIVASEIHLNDLDASCNQMLVKEDVELLGELSNGNILHLHEGGVNYFKDDIEKLVEFHENGDEEKEVYEILETILGMNQSAYNDTTPLTKEQKESNAILVNLIPGLDKCNTMGEMLKIMMPFILNMSRNPELYRDYLKSIRSSSINLSDRSGNWAENEVFKEISNSYKEHFKGKTYREIMNSIVDEKTPTKLYDEFERDYMNLEIIGVASEKTKKKGLSIKNTLADIQHCYLASFCDILCSNDNNMRRKFQILSHEYGIKTKALSLEELESLLPHHIHHLQDRDLDSLIPELLFYHTNTSNPTKSNIEGYETTTISLDFLFLVYFNELSIMWKPSNEVKSLLLSRREHSFSQNSFKCEITNLVKRMYTLSPSRFDNNMEFKFEEIADYIYEGILFQGARYSFYLKLNKKEVRPYLYIVETTNENKQPK